MSADDDISGRSKSAVLGAFVADAATMGLHWIYDQGKIASLVAEKGTKAHPEFFQPPSCPFYKAESGAMSPYGAEMYPVVKYLVEHGGKVDGKTWAKYLAAYYKTCTGYLNKTSKHVVEQVGAGKEYPATGDPEDMQANALVKAIPVAALYAGRPELSHQVEAAVRAQQNNDKAVAYGLAAARILEKIILGSSTASAVEWAVSSESGVSEEVRGALRAALEAKDLPLNEAVTKLGASCGNPGALQSAVLIALMSDNYVVAVRSNLLAGGDNCSRSMLLGAMLAAENGHRAIPTEWTDKTSQYDDLEEMVDSLVALRS